MGGVRSSGDGLCELRVIVLNGVCLQIGLLFSMPNIHPCIHSFG